MTDSQVQAKAIIAAALIQSRAIDPEGMASLNKDISAHKLAHLRELTDFVPTALCPRSRRRDAVPGTVVGTGSGTKSVVGAS